jgi:hypothetical protein
MMLTITIAKPAPAVPNESEGLSKCGAISNWRDIITFEQRTHSEHGYAAGASELAHGRFHEEERNAT